MTSSGSDHPYNTFSSYLKQKFGERMRRIPLDPGFPCPHRDPLTGQGGCVYCEGSSFFDPSLKGLSLEEQLQKGIEKLNSSGIKKHIAYFQNATSTNTDIDGLEKALETVKGFPSISAISISTRPDCIDDEKLALIGSYGGEYDVWIEYGFQTAKDDTLRLINRGHSFEQSRSAIIKTASYGIKTALHIIVGLPYENRSDMLRTAEIISRLPVWGIKFHVLHVVKGTALNYMYEAGKFKIPDLEEYCSLVCDMLEILPREMVVLRLVSSASRDGLVAPLWMNDTKAAIEKIKKEFVSRGTFQGARSES